MVASHPNVVWTDAGGPAPEDCASSWAKRTWHEGHYHSVRETWVCVATPEGDGPRDRVEEIFFPSDGRDTPDAAFSQSFLKGDLTPSKSSGPTPFHPPSSKGGASGGSGFSLPGGGGSFSGGGGASGTGTVTGTEQVSPSPDMVVTPIGTSGLSLMLALGLLLAVRSRLHRA